MTFSYQIVVNARGPECPAHGMPCGLKPRLYVNNPSGFGITWRDDSPYTGYTTGKEPTARG